MQARRMRMAAGAAATGLALWLGACEPGERPPAQGAPASDKEARSEAVDAERAAELAARARTLTDQFQAQLKQRLMAAMQEGGPGRAIEVCKVAAPEIGASATDGEGLQGWSIGRTSQRVRNPNNAPNDWQRRGLRELAARADAPNVEVGSLDWQEVATTESGGSQWRYMRAIPTGGLCLTCHGDAEALPPPVKAKLAELYPEDQATGFAEGDLRGAFVVTAPL